MGFKKMFRYVAFITVIAPLLLTTTAYALVVDLELLTMDFRFNNPGARANAMGGAFIGLADDATAAYTNPAGLSILTEPEISLEYKYGNYTNRVSLFDFEKDFDDSTGGVSFVSIVYPKNRATFSLFRHQLINLVSDYRFHGGDLDLDTDIDMEAITTGGGMSLKISDSLSLGLAINFSELTYNYLLKKYDSSSFSEPHDAHMIVSDEDKAEHYTVSVLWSPYEAFNIGLVYRQGPEFDTEKTEWEYISDSYDQINLYENTLKVPDIYGIGISCRLISSLTIAVDINYIEYSDLLKNLIVPEDSGTSADYDIDDTTEIHLGLEYIFDMSDMPLAVRCGYYSKPQHRLEYTGDKEDLLELIKKGDDDDIFSIGLGSVISKNVQVDIAASAGDFVKEYIASFVYRFE